MTGHLADDDGAEDEEEDGSDVDEYVISQKKIDSKRMMMTVEAVTNYASNREVIFPKILKTKGYGIYTSVKTSETVTRENVMNDHPFLANVFRVPPL